MPAIDPSQRLVEYAGRYLRDGPERPALTPEPKMLRVLADCCRRRSDLLEKGSDHSKGLVAVSAHWRDWLRPLETWEPPGDADGPGQFRSLTGHLFAPYEVPRCLDSAWLAGLDAVALRHQGWYKHVGRGENIRTAAGLPVPLSRGMAHRFAQAPGDLDIPSALRWAQVRGMGGDDRLAGVVLDGRIGVDFANDDFWLTVIRWMIDHPELTPRVRGMIIDYLHDQKFVPSIPNPLTRQPGRERQPLTLAPQPDLSMKGRTPASLLRAVEQWHKRPRSPLQGVSFDWKPSGIRPFSIALSQGPATRTYAITELITLGELHEEGTAMNHCVASYASWCRADQSSIWSMTVEEGAGPATRLLTLEVRMSDRGIVQAKGPDNREADDLEWSLLLRWAEAGGAIPGRRLIFGDRAWG